MPIDRPKPSLHFTADDIKEFRKFSIGDTIIVQAKGVITDLRRVNVPEKDGEPMCGVDIEVSGIFAEKPITSSESKPKDMEKAYQRSKKQNMET